MIVKRYRPAFMEGFDNPESDIVSFSDNSTFNLTDILEIPWIKTWSKNETFYRFSQSERSYNTKQGKVEVHTLMCELENGFKWWVVARANSPFFDLPKWEAKYDS